MERIVVDLQAGTTTVVPLTQEEIVQAQAQKAAWDAEQAAIVKAPTMEDIVAQLQAEIALLKGAA
jgi:predicted ATPase